MVTASALQESSAEHCGFVTADGRQVHYRRRGTGPAMIMMHASPLSSTSLRGAMRVFGDHFTCIALDNPGFGLSEPLANDQGNIWAHADALMATIRALGLDRPIVYGASTGAAIAHAFGCRYPEALSLCMLDTFSHHDTDDMLGGYFPDIRPRRDGAHLLAAWENISGLYLFSPWQKAEASRRQIRDFPGPEVLHDMVVQLLTASQSYEELYSAAISWEDIDNVDRLKAPATLNIWESASGFERVKLVVERGLPENYTPIHSDAASGRYRRQLRYLLQRDFESGIAAAPRDASATLPRHYRSLYVETRSGSLHARASAGVPDARPLVLLHDWGGSSRAFDGIAARLADRHPVVAFDLPGHGDTPLPYGEPEGLVSLCVDAVADALATLGVTAADVVGTGAGYLLAEALATRHAGLVNRTACLATAPLITDAATLGALADSALSFEPDVSGAHLLRAHAVAKHRDLFWTWWDRRGAMALARANPLDPDRLQRRTIELLKSGSAYVDLHRATRGLPIGLAREPLCFVPDWQCGGEPLLQQLPETLRDRAQVLPGDARYWADSISEALTA